MASPTLVAAASFVLLAVAVVGLYEYTLYTPEQRERAGVAARVYFVAWIVAVKAGLAGVGASLLYGRANWLAVSLIAVLAGLLAPIQFWMHRRMGVEDSPLVERYL